MQLQVWFLNSIEPALFLKMKYIVKGTTVVRVAEMVGVIREVSLGDMVFNKLRSGESNLKT